ncbi:Lrp/AsnC family transcriptional regulator [Anaeroselena agilis]|uniref:Lrp/AsnC family transcriptional regulator n=1 Tax=Anaeroselena agilis TaxID=3063788 RepID=A0ABU3P2J9_9FIRM|nr:Lrp/AsnC family transcriptional regulator [Selenomonadales bacterium 4137-cl]
MLDDNDCKIVDALMANARATWAELGALLGLSAPAAADRVRRLEQRGVIKGYAALLDPDAIGCGFAAFIAVTLEKPEHRAPFLAKVAALPEILECHHAAGDDDYFLKVRCTGPRHLEKLISEELKALPGIVRTRTTVILSTVKETPVLPLGPAK